jgi:hypothetical protein
MTKLYRYSMLSAGDYFDRLNLIAPHPQKDILRIAPDASSFEPVPPGDCWFFTASTITGCPSYIEEVERPLVEALERIRRAPRNESPTVAWMQRVAAWALEPHKWPKPESEPPIAHVVFRMGAQVSITDPVWSDEPVTTGWVEGYTEDGRCVVRLNDPERRLQTFAVEHLRHGWRPGVQ